MSVLRLPSLLALASASSIALGAAAAGCPAPLPGDEDWPGQKQWQALEQTGFVFGHLKVEVGDIYESGDAWYAAAANFLHIDTRDRVVREHLVIAPGDKVQARRVYESMRELRSLGIFREARITPIGCADGVVEARVAVDDAWTLILSLKANSVGGQTNTGLRLEDRNFLGTGKEVYVEKSNDADRSTISYAYDDPALFGSDWRLFALHADQSDGKSNQLGIRLPFLTLEQEWGFDFQVVDTEQDLTFYQAGERAWVAPSINELTTATAWRLLDLDDDHGWRVGFGARSENREYGAPLAIDPTLRPAPVLNPYQADGLVLAINRFHDHYASFQNIALVDRIEDINLGLDATFRMTINPEVFGGGAGEESTRYDLVARWAGRVAHDHLLELGLASGVRDDDGEWNDGLISTTFAWYDQSTPRQTRLARLGLDWRADPDPEHEVSLGGEDGLLGYPAHYLVGDRAWKLHLENRFYTDKVLFQTLKVGYSVVVEAGAARRIGTREWSETLADVGVGFRLGNLRGAYGQVLYFTVFTPLVREDGVDAVQFVVGDVISF